MSDSSSSSAEGDEAELSKVLKDMETNGTKKDRTGSVSSKSSTHSKRETAKPAVIQQTSDNEDSPKVQRVESTYENTDNDVPPYAGPINPDDHVTYDDIPLNQDDAIVVEGRPVGGRGHPIGVQGHPYPHHSSSSIHEQQPPVKPSRQMAPRNPIIDLENRDPTNMNEIVKVEFEDIFAEPSTSHSIDVIWTTSERVFSITQFWCYRILTAIFAVPCAICWGCNFACLSCCYIWNVRPTIKQYAIQIDPWSRVCGMYIKAFCVPVFETMGLLFNKIRINWKKD